MSLMQQIKADQLAARKNRESGKALLLTTLIGEAQTIGKNDGNRETNDAEVTAVIKKFVKNIGEVLKVADSTSNTYLTAIAEKEVLESYLPKQISGQDLQDLIRGLAAEVGAVRKADMGKLMGALKLQHEGTYDGSEASLIVRSILV
jgi:uncharacterized protein YqeY